MPTKKRAMNVTPPDWVDHLYTHDEELGRVRLVWRTGARAYRPVISLFTDLEQLDGAPDSAWDELECKETHFHWLTTADETNEAKRARVADVAGRLWGYCQRFARATGQCCDFRLRGYAGTDEDDDDVLFESGARFDPNHEAKKAPPYDYPPPPQPQASQPSFDWADLEAEHKRVHTLKDSLLGRITEERNRTDDDYRKLAQMTPTLLTHAGDILERAIGFQERAVEGLVNQRTGQIEIQIRAFAEEQETKREAMRLEWRRYAFDAFLGSALPTAKTIFEAWANRTGTPFQEFHQAQQAIAFLGMTLDEVQLITIFKGNLASSKLFMQILEHAASQEVERDAIEALQGCEAILRSRRFRSAADAAQQLAARFIISRAALYRMGDLDPHAPN